MAEPRKPSRRRKLLFLAVYGLFLVLLLAVVGEVAVRLMGFRPFRIQNVDIKVEPGGRFFTPHPRLGYTQLPGAFKVTLGDKYSFNATHGADTLRVTHPIPTDAATGKAKPEIWIHGCSYTHGWSLNDSNTYPWLVQEKMPEYEVRNFGVNGYGTLHSLIQFREELAKGRKPKVVVVAYAWFHDERNTFLRARRKAVAPYNHLGMPGLPFARLGSDGNATYFMTPVEFREWPLMRYSAFVHFVETKYDELEERLAHSRDVTRAILRDFARESKAAGAEFVVAGITRDTDKVLEACRKEGMRTVDIWTDLTQPGMRNLPYDDHPSARADAIYADKLTAYLREILK
jgi:hypothetical protein